MYVCIKQHITVINGDSCCPRTTDPKPTRVAAYTYIYT